MGGHEVVEMELGVDEAAAVAVRLLRLAGVPGVQVRQRPGRRRWIVRHPRAGLVAWIDRPAPDDAPTLLLEVHPSLLVAAAALPGEVCRFVADADQEGDAGGEVGLLDEGGGAAASCGPVDVVGQAVDGVLRAVHRPGGTCRAVDGEALLAALVVLNPRASADGRAGAVRWRFDGDGISISALDDHAERQVRVRAPGSGAGAATLSAATVQALVDGLVDPGPAAVAIADDPELPLLVLRVEDVHVVVHHVSTARSERHAAIAAAIGELLPGADATADGDGTYVLLDEPRVELRDEHPDVSYVSVQSAVLSEVTQDSELLAELNDQMAAEPALRLLLAGGSVTARVDLPARTIDADQLGDACEAVLAATFRGPAVAARFGGRPAVTVPGDDPAAP